MATFSQVPSSERAISIKFAETPSGIYTDVQVFLPTEVGEVTDVQMWEIGTALAATDVLGQYFTGTPYVYSVLITNTEDVPDPS